VELLDGIVARLQVADGSKSAGQNDVAGSRTPDSSPR